MKISAVSSLKRTVLGHDSVYYVKKGTDYLNRAEQQHQNKRFSEAQRIFGKAQHTFNKIHLSDKTDTLNRTLAQAYLEYGDRLRDRGALLEARAVYEAARVFDAALANERLQALDGPKPSPIQASVSDMVMALAIQTGKPPSLSPQIETVYFKSNPVWVKTDEDVSGEPKNIRNTYHLARSLRSAEFSSAQKLNELARNILETFGQRAYKDLAIWREVIPLAATLDPEKCCYLIGEAHKVIAKPEKLLNPSVLQSMAVMIHHLPESLFKSSTGDLVQLLKALIKRLESEHQPGNTQSFQQLLQTMSQVLDAMAKAGVTGISRTEVQEPLDQILAGLSQEPALRFQAYYARQALAHIPNDESRWQEAWRRSTNIVLGAATLASAVRTFDPNKLMETYSCFVEAFSGTGELIKRVAELASEMKDFGSSVQEAGTAAYKGLAQNRQARWYAALQFLDTCLEERQWVQFEQIATQSEFSGNEAFLLGVCQRLEHIVRTQKEEETQKAALAFLSDLVLNSPQYERVQQAVYQVLSRLAKIQTVSEQVQKQAQQALEQLPPTETQAESAEDLYIAPVWDPAWQQVGTQLLYQARGDEHFLTQFQTTALQSNKAPLALLGKDIRALEAQYTQSLKADEVKEALELYIAPQGKLSVEATEHFDLEEKVNAFLASDKKVLLLLGEGGSGKSTFNRHLARRLWAEYTQAENAQERPIPLFIPLASLDHPGKNLIEQYLKEQDLSDAQIEALRKDRRFIFILDGYDEIAHRSQAFYAGNKLDRWQTKVIISSRPEYLGAHYQNKFYPSGSPSLLEECRLVGFSDRLIENYIDKYVAYAKPQWAAHAYKEAFKTIPELRELVRTPFMLKMTLEVLPTLKAQGLSAQSKLTRIRLYETFVENWLNRSQERLARIQLTQGEQDAFEQLDEQGFTTHGWAYSQKLALAMYEAQLVRVTYSEAQDANQDWRSEYLGDAAEKIRLLRFSAPLSRQGDQYRFIHKSIRDYFVARGIWEALGSSAVVEGSTGSGPLNGMKNVQWLWEALDPSIQPNPSALLNRFNLVEDVAIQRFLVERVEQDSGLVKLLLAWIQASKQTDTVSQGSANSMTVLVKVGVQLNGMDLQGIRIPGADLNFGMLDSTQLQGSDLSGVKLRASWLREANLSGAQMAGVQFGEWPYLEEEDMVNSCAYSPDGKTYAAGLCNSTISVYWTSNWEKTYTLEGHKSSVNSLAYSPNGEQIASGSNDKTVRVWDAGSGTLRRILEGHEASINSVVYSPNGGQIASGSDDKTVRLWDAESGASGYTLEGHTSWVNSVAYSPNGRQIASGSMDLTVRLWDMQSGKLHHTLRGHRYSVNSVAYSPSSQQIASGSDDQTVRLWDTQSGTLRFILLGHTASVWSVVYSPSGKQIASGSGDHTLRLWDAQNGEPGLTLQGHTDAIISVVYSPSGQQIASGTGNHTRLWDAQNEAPSLTLQGHTACVVSVAYSPSGQQIVSGSDDYTVRLWDTKSGKLGLTLQGHTEAVFSVVYSPSGQQIASGSLDSTVRLWDAQNGILYRTLQGHKHAVESVAYSPNGKQIVSGSEDKTVRLWDAQSGKLHHTLKGHTDSVRSVAYPPNGQQIASGSLDHTVRLWDAQSGELRHTLKGHTDGVLRVVYSPNGRQIASGSLDYTVRLWDAQSGKPRHTLKGHIARVLGVVYSPNGEQIASGSWDNTIRLWEVQTGQCQMNIQDCGLITSLAWKETSYGHYLGMGSVDNSVRQWEVKKEGKGYKVNLCWSSTQSLLTVRGTSIEGVHGLSEMNGRLLKQRGATGEPLPLNG